MSDLDPGKLIASFDSASVLHDAVITALKGRPFPHLGAPRWQALAVRAAGHLPWPILRQIYTRLGAAEGIDPQRLGDVDMGAVAQWFADQVPDRRYPAIMIGSSNGALAHLAAALDVPWLPDTVLVPVAHADDSDRADDVLEFGARVAPALLERNPDITLHHMHDPLQDELMSRWMSYFRVKWRALPTAYTDLVRNRLRPGGQVIMVDDTSTWPVTRVAERHVFQAGGRGGTPPKDYLSRQHTPAADETAPEAEWGLDRSMATDLTRWCEAASIPLSTISYDGPQAPAAAVAETMRDWYRSRGETADRLVVPSFVLGDPWSTVNAAAVPFWTFFAVQPARAALDDYLGHAEPYRDVHVFLFEHGVPSPGIATPADFADTIRRHGAQPHLEAFDLAKFPHDIGSMARYGPAFQRLPRARTPWSPLPVADALSSLAAHGLTVSPVSAGQERA